MKNKRKCEKDARNFAEVFTFVFITYFREVTMTEDQYALYGMKMGPGRMPRTNQMYDPTR